MYVNIWWGSRTRRLVYIYTCLIIYANMFIYICKYMVELKDKTTGIYLYAFLFIYICRYV